ncbi:MAG: hypothetical protein ACJAZY_003018 [Spirosomataceae bacterium]|jgi:hypothetical protein
MSTIRNTDDTDLADAHGEYEIRVNPYYPFNPCSILLVLIFASTVTFAQSDSTKNKGFLSGSLQIEAQRYEEDKNLPFQTLENQYGFNTYLQLNYQYKKFRIGVRGESYAPVLIGYPSNLKGVGLASRFVSYQGKKWGATLGNFYEQFGNGLILRAQEQRPLGMDTSIDGLKVAFTDKKYNFTAFTGKQRLSFRRTDGWLSGFNNSLIISNSSASYFLKIGGSIVNKNESYDGILTIIKPNVWAWSSRVDYAINTFSVQAEYAQKSPDASPANRFITRTGRAFLLNADWFVGNLTTTLQLKRIENMDFRSQRGEMLNNALINYVPVGTKQQTYRLLTLYPYASQVLGEIGGQFDATYSLNNGSTLAFNASAMNGLKRYETNTDEGYTTKFFEVGEQKYYRNASLEFDQQFTDNFHGTFVSDFTQFNREVILGGRPEIVSALTFIADGTWKLSKKHALHAELQHLSTKQDLGNWAMALAEVSIAPHYFFYVSDEINYGDFNFTDVQHYYNIGTAYSLNANRISLSYGRVREGLLCVGGICRIIPAYKGLSLSVMSSF